MSKITLSKAKEILNEINLVDVFASIVSNTVIDSNLKLQTYKKLYKKIFDTERHFGLDIVSSQIELLKIEEHYYAPQNAVFYYKDIITPDVKEINAKTWDNIQDNIKMLEDKINEISMHIYIEVTD